LECRSALARRKRIEEYWTRRTKDHAITKRGLGIGCSRGFALVDQPVHTDARDDQIDLKRRSGDRRGVVASERVWTIQLFLAYPRRELNAKAADSGLFRCIASSHDSDGDSPAADGVSSLE
jgi:hypothetical protein